jgi:hypothetical protein
MQRRQGVIACIVQIIPLGVVGGEQEEDGDTLPELRDVCGVVTKQHKSADPLMQLGGGGIGDVLEARSQEVDANVRSRLALIAQNEM